MEESTQQPSGAKGMNMTMVLLGVIILVLLGGGAYYYMNQKSAMAPAMQKSEEKTETMQESKGEGDKMTATSMPSQSPSTATSGAAAAMPSGKVVEVTIKGQNYSFSPNVITAKKGDTVKVTFQNTGGFHDFVIDEFTVKTKTIKDGESDSVSFVADKTGTFEFYCSVGQHRQMGMKGTLTVQ